MKQYLFLFLLFTIALGSWNPTVQNDIRVDQTILQISARYSTPLPEGFFSQPQRREPIVAFLRHAVDSIPLTVGEKEDVTLILQRLEGERALFSKENENARIQVNLDLTGDIRVRSEDSTGVGLKGIIAPGISGNLGKFSFRSEFDVWTEYASDSLWPEHFYEPHQGNPYNLFGRADTGNIRASDMLRAGASWDLGLVRFDAGVDHIKTGPVIKNPLMLNIDKSPIAYARYSLNFPWLNYVHTAMVPQTFKDMDRYMMNHRFEIPFLQKRLIVGFNETVLYGSTPDSAREAELSHQPLQADYYNTERTFQPVYLIPFMPFAFAEHFTGDRDNALLSFDFALRIPQNFYWYLEFLLDDMSSPATLFSDDWGNKWGLSVGGQWFGTVADKNLTVSVEYSRIEPWVYTHFRGSSHRYTHYGSAIGSDMGPNSDMIWSDVAFQLNQKNRFSLSFENRRWNHELRGGSMYDGYISDKVAEQSVDENGNATLVEDGDTKIFLDGNVTSEQIVTAKWAFLPYHLFEMTTECSYSSEKSLALALYGGFRF